VVAEEVRNLAQRSAEAARTTAQLIEDSSKSAESGAAATQVAAKKVNEILGCVESLHQLIGGVAGASGEQAQGIDQIHKAVAELDQATQANAAHAQETAAAIEQLAGQGRNLDALVRVLR
jgi:methyl-accepting chemotaxis protein